MPARVIVIGLDAAEATLVEQLSAEGRLPTFARIAAEGSVARLGNSLESLPGAIWPELTTGRSGGKLGHFFHPLQLHTGETRLRKIEADEVDTSDYYWTIASRQGRRVAVVDQPQTVLTPEVNGIHLLEWGLHDRNFKTQSHPPELLDDLRAQYGDHPVDFCDSLHGGTQAGFERLAGLLLEGLEKKEALLLDLLGREDWDLFTCAFSETHCIGHQLWHFFEASEAGDTSVPKRLAEAIPAVYQRVDEAVGRLLESAGEDATALILLSHGMGPRIGGPQLLPELLVRLGAGSGRGRLASVRSRLPVGLRVALRRLVPGRSRERLREVAGSLPWPLESSSTRAIAVPNNRVGGIRLNLRGREPYGCIEPGAEADSVLAELRQALLELEDPASGERVVDHVVTAEEAFGAERHPDVPDLMVVFRTDLGRIESFRSSRVGVLSAPANTPDLPRTGDHTVESRLWAIGPDIPPGGELPAGANVLDIAPTVLALLDVPVPDSLDGRPLLGAAATA